MLRAVGIFLKVVGVVLATIAAGVLVLILWASWADGRKNKDSYACTIRRMDHHIAPEQTDAYHDTCMAALGYSLIDTCYSLNIEEKTSFCYYRKWLW